MFDGVSVDTTLLFTGGGIVAAAAAAYWIVRKALNIFR